MKTFQQKLFVAAALSVGAALCACSSIPKPDLPDGSERIPVNTSASMQQYQEHLESQYVDPSGRPELQRQIEAMKREIATLKQFIASQGRRQDKHQQKTPIVPKLQLTAATLAFPASSPSPNAHLTRSVPFGTKPKANKVHLPAHPNKGNGSRQKKNMRTQTPRSRHETEVGPRKVVQDTDIKLVMNRRVP